ncbi:MAG: nitrite reductase large subunit [Hyphomicrobiales bacterium]|jgi:nitrite reductase (NADH) large subunit|nr:nitrite reductase large subunit [Hyphomicrobiales bacterium]
MSEPLVIIGNGMAAARFADELSSRALGRYAVAVVGAEPRLAYNRVLLSSVLAGEVASSDIELKPHRWWRDRGITLRYGCGATAVDTKTRSVTLADGASLEFSKLVFATGSQPIKPPIPGMALPGVITFRDIGDIHTIWHRAGAGDRVVVIGGGLLGLEAAYGLAKAGARVTVLHLMDRLMERQLDPPAAAMLRRAVEAMGVEIVLKADTAEISGKDRVDGVVLKDGRTIEADAVVVAIGIRPSADLARDAGIAINRGIVVDDALETDVPGIHAIGECAEHRGTCYGLVEPAHEQARVLSERLAGRDTHYRGSVLATNLKVSGVNVFSAGDFLGDEGTDEIVLSDLGLGVYKKLVIAGGRLTGAVLFGDTADGLWYLDLIRSGASIEPMRDDLAFGRAFAERALTKVRAPTAEEIAPLTLEAA